MTYAHGIHHDVPEAEYHSHPALSNSRAKLLVPPSTPLKFKHALDQAEKPKRHFELGKAVHAKVLGTPLDVVAVQKVTPKKEVVDADDYLTKSAQTHRDEIRAAGQIPLLRAEIDQVDAMTEAILRNPDARQIMEFPSAPEVSAFWRDPDTGVECRARFDWLPEVQPGRRLVISDVKTADSAYPSAFARQAGKLLYDMQDAIYTNGAQALGLDDDPAFVFVVVEKEEPYDVAVIQLDEDSKKRGRALMETTRRIYAECLATDTWPGIPHGVHTAGLPAYEHYRFEEFTG